MSRIVWSELFGPAREVTKRRLGREIARSDRLYGHLANASDPERLRTF